MCTVLLTYVISLRIDFFLDFLNRVHLFKSRVPLGYGTFRSLQNPCQYFAPSRGNSRGIPGGLEWTLSNSPTLPTRDKMEWILPTARAHCVHTACGSVSCTTKLCTGFTPAAATEVVCTACAPMRVKNYAIFSHKSNSRITDLENYIEKENAWIRVVTGKVISPQGLKCMQINQSSNLIWTLPFPFRLSSGTNPPRVHTGYVPYTIHTCIYRWCLGIVHGPSMICMPYVVRWQLDMCTPVHTLRMLPYMNWYGSGSGVVSNITLPYVSCMATSGCRM